MIDIEHEWNLHHENDKIVKLRSRIELLEKVVKRQSEAIDYYCKHTTWRSDPSIPYSKITWIDENDVDVIERHFIVGPENVAFNAGGKLARLVKQECEKMIKNNSAN